MRVRFWGTRGSLPKPGHDTLRYGGNTSCIEVRSADGTLIILDCGSGAHGLGQTLLADQGARRGHLFISHTHWDHIQGVPFFAPFFVSGNEWDIYAPRGLAQSLQETLAGQMQYAYFPITLEQMGATIRYHDLVEGVFQVGDVTVRTQYLNHPALTLGYRLESAGATLVYACDHEPYARGLANGDGKITGPDQHHADFLAGADLVIHDAQYTASEYATKVGWGHSSMEYALAVSGLAGAKRLALTHHDPLRTDDRLDQIITDVRANMEGTGPPLEVFAAAEGKLVELLATSEALSKSPAKEFSAETYMSPALQKQSVLLGVVDPERISIFTRALQADGMQITLVSNASAVLQLVATTSPSLIILDLDLPDLGGLEICHRIRSAPTAHAREVPVIIVAKQEDLDAGAAVGVTDWLIGSFSTVYVRTRVRAWLIRARCRWMRAPIPDDEEHRLAALHQSGILDTQPEERFDRLTRLTRSVFGVSLALVSLIDRNRQWLKSCHGLATREIPREMSFCAHAILDRTVTIVPDTMLDPRFADNPQVTGEPHIRFYAGCPLIIPSGGCVGTLCIIDTRPHELDEVEIQLLQDLGRLVEQELCTSPTSCVPPRSIK